MIDTEKLEALTNDLTRKQIALEGAINQLGQMHQQSTSIKVQLAQSSFEVDVIQYMSASPQVRYQLNEGCEMLHKAVQNETTIQSSMARDAVGLRNNPGADCILSLLFLDGK